jgi:GWxTD domain-containing protein
VRCSMRFLLYTLMAVMMLCIADPSVFAKDKESKLPQQYREWLDRDVAYLITRSEKAQFLALSSDAERDKFIDWFWAIRNPDPESSVNAYKEEHYKRLAYVDDHFGIGKRVPGWATDRGRIYILLGPPKQTGNYQGFDRVRPMQIWFYEANIQGLPPFFSVLFYKRDSFGDYRTYSPYFDGPQELVTERGVTTSIAVQMIQRDVGQEVARTSLSLLPDEPVDTSNPFPTMQSDILMSQLHDWANSSYNVAALQHRAAMMSVSSRLLVGGDTLGVVSTPLRDSQGHINLHYLLRLKKPEDFALGKSTDGSYYFSVEARVYVFTNDEKLIFTQERTIKHPIPRDNVDQLKHKVFGFEDWLPLAPGQYHLKFSLGNPVNQTAYQSEANVTVPGVPGDGLVITPLIPFTSAVAVQPALSGLIPFSAAGVRFSPLLPREMNYSPATDLQFFYQVWAGHDVINLGSGSALEARYAFGRPGGLGEAKIITDQVEANQIDATGTLLTGKKITIGDWAQGNYLLTLSVNGPDAKQKASATMSFRLLLAVPTDPDWDVFDGDAISKDVVTGITEYERGLCYLAFNQKAEAARSFQEALYKNPRFEDGRAALVNVESDLGNYSRVAQIARDYPVTADTQSETALRLAEALDKVDETREAIDLLQGVLRVKSASGPVYLALASYYRRIGDEKSGEDFQKKGQALSRDASSHQ